MFIESLSAKYRTRKKFLPYSLPTISEEEINEVTSALQSGFLASGPRTKLFENKFAEYVGVKNAIAVNSGTAALHLALVANGIETGDEVIIPTMTFPHTANAVVHCGAKPVFADVGDDLNIKVSEITRLITSKTKAIIPFDFAGQPAALTEIMAIAKNHHLVVIEDAVQALGSSYRGKKIGSISPITIFSFCPTDNMTTIEGGMVVTNDNDLAEKIRTLSLYGIDKRTRKCFINQGSWFYEITCPGYKYNMNDIQAALGLCQLHKLERFLANRRRYASIYTEAFRFIPEITILPVNRDSLHSWGLYVIILNLEKLSINRTQFIEALRFENIGAGVDFIPIHLQPFYQMLEVHHGSASNSLPNAEWFYERMVSLPLYPRLTETDINDTIRAISKIVKRMRR
jgi:dTDP-4-amino-4,6-dideoxygalactose transaminase